jgi:hypothetical protein
MAEVMYKTANPQASAPASAAEAPREKDEVIDADFENVA